VYAPHIKLRGKEEDVKYSFVLYEYLHKWNTTEKSASMQLANFTSVYGARIIYNIQAHFPSSDVNVM
jgi:hypothetical protein